MSRRKRTPKTTTPATTSELAADRGNPRAISPHAAAGLGHSLDQFGDLSGIVWNRRTGTLVCGHQRLDRIHAQWGPQPITILDADRELGAIVVDDDHVFPVRIVDWPAEKQTAANVTANNPKIAGEFTDDLATYLDAARLAETMPGILDDVLLGELLADYAAAPPAQLTKVDVQPPPPMTWVLVGIATPRFGRIAKLVEDLAAVPEIILESTLNNG